MSALAQLLQDQGCVVSGSDRDVSPVTELLARKGIVVARVQSPENVPADTELVIYSDAVWEDNPERVRAKELGIPQQSYFEVLGDVSKGKRTVAVSGVHGKTTVTGMTAKILLDAGASPTAIVGSLVRDFNSNYLKGDSDIFIVEACEYKNHFHHLSPHVLVVTNIEWDHTDYFKSLEEIQNGFKTLMERVPKEGFVVTNPSDPNIAPLLSGVSATVIDYTKEPAYEVKLPGEFNVMNARAAACAARAILPTISGSSIYGTLAGFQGTWRRFEYKGKTKRGADVYDDYAHHPTAVKKTLAELRKKSKGKVFVAFHPHLYSRTRDLLSEFAGAFTDADTVIIAPIYPAREPDDGVTSNALLASEIAKHGVDAKAGDFVEIRRFLETKPEAGDVIMTMGAGDIYHVADELVLN